MPPFRVHTDPIPILLVTNQSELPSGMSVDLTQLRYPVVCWAGRTPLHQIRALAIAFPQTTLYDQRSTTGDSHEESKSSAPDLPPLCSLQHPPHAFLLSGSLTGELAHWYIPSYRSSAEASSSQQQQRKSAAHRNSHDATIVVQRKACGSNQAVPRAMLLRQGAAACTALTYCRDGLTQMFCAGTSEGFLSLWSVGGGKCIRSELVLPFAPSQILFYQRYNPLAHGRSLVQRSPSPPPAGSPGSSSSGVASPVPSSTRRPSAVHLHNYLLCCSEESRDVYVVELPSLALLATLTHRAPVLSMALVPPRVGKQRTPYLVTVTAHHHVCMWDLSLIEKKHDEKKRIRAAQQLQAQRSRPGSAFSITVSSPAVPTTTMSGEQLPALPNLSHPISSLASNSASIITSGSSSSTPASSSSSSSYHTNSSTHQASNAPSMGSLVVRWDEPTQSFLLPLPPLSFTLSPLFVPISLCISPCGSRIVVLFPYAFITVSLATCEMEGRIRTMQEEVRRSSNGVHEESFEDGVEHDGTRERTDCISKHASWAGAGFLTTPHVGPAGSQPPSDQTQHLVLWNATGEFIWVYAVTSCSSSAAESNSSETRFQTPQKKIHPAHSSAGSQSLVPLSSSSSGGLTRSLSSTRLTSEKKSASERLVDEGGHAAEAPELGATATGRQTSGLTSGAPEFHLVAKCIMVDTRFPSHPLSPKVSPATIAAPPVAQLVTVQLSGHTIFAGTNDGEIYQFHIPICSHPNLFSSIAEQGGEEPKVYTPTHVSRMSDAFQSHHAPTTPNAVDPTGSPSSPHLLSPLPQFPRAMSTPFASSLSVDSTPRSSPRRPISPGVTADPPTASSMIVDPWHEAVILAVGHSSGALRIHNIHSKGSAPVDLPMLHQGMVTCMLNVVGWVDACILATGGVDGRIMITEVSSARLQLTLHCHAPVLSLHKPSSVGEESLGPFYKGANSTLLFACCSDITLRCFSLSTGSLLFTGRALDSAVKAIWRPNWAVVSDTVVCQTKAGTVYVYSMTSEYPQQIIELDSGANSFLQKHDLVVPGSQLSILAHRLYQMKHLKKKALPAISASPSPSVSPPLSRSVSSSELKKQSSSDSLISVGGGGGGNRSVSPVDPAMMGGETAKMIFDEGHFSSGLPAPIPSAGGSPSPSPDSSSSPPSLSRVRSTLMARATPTKSSSRNLLAAVPNPRTLLQRQRSSGSNLVDSSFQKEIYRLNQQALMTSTEKAEEESRRHALQHANQQHHSALNPPVHQVAHAPPRAAQPTPGAPLKSMYVNTPAPSASPPPAAPAPAPIARSPIACVDVVTAPGSSASPLQHLHANVYVWNVHQLLPYLAAHAGVFLTFAKRRAAIEAAAADPTNAALQASAYAAQAANATRLPPIFYVISGLLSTLFDWDAHSPLDHTLRSSLLLYPPSPSVSPASLSDNSQSMTLLLPNQARDWRRWEIDGEVTARHQMAITTTMMSLMEKSDPASPAIPWFAQCLQFYHTTMPRALRLYAEADLNVLALFALNVHRPVHTAARLLISLALDRLSPSSRLDLALAHGHFFEYALPAQRMLFQPEFTLSPADLVASGSIMAVCENGPGIGYVSEEEMLHCALLCWLGLYELKQQRKNAQGMQMLRAADITSLATLHEGISAFQTKSQFLTNTLLRMIAWPVATELEYVKCALACDLLAKGLLVFRHHITEPLLLLRRLYSLTQHPYDPLSKAATQCLLDSGKIAPTHFITCIGREAMNYRSTPTARQGALMCVVSLIKKHPFALARSLPAVVRMIVGTLDPAEPALRKTLLQASTSALYALAACYPQVSFNQATQRYAVGTANGPNSVIIVYDLRTATKWRVLEGHTGEVHAVSFHPKGLSLASYSATENPPSVRVWSTGGGGFFSGLLGMEGKCTNSWPMLPCVKKDPDVKSVVAPLQPSAGSKTSAASSASTSSTADLEADAESASEIVDVDEPIDEDEDSDNGATKSLAPRVQPRTAAIGGRASSGAPAGSARFSLEELMAVKLMWITEITIKLRREDGTMVDFSL